MPSTCSIRPGNNPHRLLATNGSVITSLPKHRPQPKDYGIPSVSEINSHIACAFTPSGTTVLITPTGTDAASITNGTIREISIANYGSFTSGAYFFHASARRKRLTTGAIAAQTVTVSVNSVEVGRFKVKAAAANADPEAGYIEIAAPADATAIDSRFTISTHGISFGFTAGDSDLEVFFFAIGGD